jgi:hypothetical protein
MTLPNERYCRRCARLVACLRHADGRLACVDCSSMRVVDQSPISAVMKLTCSYLCKTCGGSGFREHEVMAEGSDGYFVVTARLRVLCECVVLTCTPDIGDCE